MFWIKLRSITAATLTLGIVTGAAGLAVRGSQEPAPPIGQPATPPPAVPAAPVPPPPTAPARSQLRERELATRKARLTADMARLTRELAELAIKEYAEVTYPRELAKAAAAIALAKDDLARSETWAALSQRRFEKNHIPQATRVADRLSVERARFELAQTKTQRDVLIKYSRDKTLKRLQSMVDAAINDERIKEAASASEKARGVGLTILIRGPLFAGSRAVSTQRFPGARRRAPAASPSAAEPMAKATALARREQKSAVAGLRGLLKDSARPAASARGRPRSSPGLGV